MDLVHLLDLLGVVRRVHQEGLLGHQGKNSDLKMIASYAFSGLFLVSLFCHLAILVIFQVATMTIVVITQKIITDV